MFQLFDLRNGRQIKGSIQQSSASSFRVIEESNQVFKILKVLQGLQRALLCQDPPPPSEVNPHICISVLIYAVTIKPIPN